MCVCMYDYISYMNYSSYKDYAKQMLDKSEVYIRIYNSSFKFDKSVHLYISYTT